MKKRVFSIAKVIYDVITTVINIFLALALAGMMYLVAGQVVARYILHIATPAYEEYARMLMVGSAFIGSAVGVRYKSHVDIDILTYVVKGQKAVTAVKLVGTVLWLAFAIWFTYLAWDFTTWAMQIKSAMSAVKWPPLWVFYSSTFIGGALLSFYLCVLLGTQIAELSKKGLSKA